jgi:hypothetical protein
MADYAISNVPRRVVYAASGVGPYAFTFEILDQTDIAVYKGSALLTLTTDYTVSINGTTGTGEVTLVATAGTSNITIVGAKNIQRTSDFTTGGDLFADTLNDELDNQTIYIQQVAETAERGLKAPVTDPTDIAMTLPAKDGRKGKVLAFDSTTGNPVAGPSLDSMVTVIEQSAYINAVGENIDDVIAVADNEANIDTVAGVSSAVTTVATNISNVNTVADDLNEPTSEIHTVGTNIANVNTVGTNIASVNTVATNIANVNTVAGISGNVTTVASISSAVTGVNAISSAVTSVNSNSTNINAVAGNATNINTVAGISGNISTVAGISSDVTTVAGIDQTDLSDVADIDSEIATVAGIAGNVTTVAGISANVTSVANNASNINQVASDTVAINSASANATSAAASALSASNSATSASASAAAASAVALGSEPVRHSVRPSLLLDFANTKTLDPRITFTRASTGTYYDGKTVAKAEENLVTYSQEFDNAAWTKRSGTTITANSSVAPDGTTTAETMNEGTASASYHDIYRASFFSVAGTYALSCYAKNVDGQYLNLAINGTGYVGAIFDLSSGTVANTGSSIWTINSTSITDVGNGWYRCVIAFTSTAGGGFNIAMTNSTTISLFGVSPTYTGTSRTILIWGAQFEQRSSVTAYTATTTAPITNYIPALQTAASGVARFEHNPVTGESLGLEIEEQRTNLLVRSEEMDNVAWAKAIISVQPNVIISPDGTLSGDKLVVDNAGSLGNVSESPGYTYGVANTCSAFVKAGEWTWVALEIRGTDAVARRTWYNLSTGVVGSSDGGSTGTITPVGNGWYRCTITATLPSGGSSSRFRIIPTNADYAFTTGNGLSGIYAWGAQAEVGSFATSYIPTVASQVTRSADSAVMTGTNFSSWYNASEGTLYSEALAGNYGAGAFGGAPGLFEISDNTLNNRIYIARSNTSLRPFLNVGVGGVTQVDLVSSTNSWGANTNKKIVAVYKVNDFAISEDGVTPATDTLGTIPVVNQAVIGRRDVISWNSTIKKIAYYPKRLTNAELQGLTTV